MTDIDTLIKRLPQNECAFGGSHGGQIYQDYPWPPLDHLPAKRHVTAERLAFISEKCQPFPWTARSVLDIGCANGAMSIGFAKNGAANVTGWDWDTASLAVAKQAAKELDVKNVKFQECNIRDGMVDGWWDIIVYLSVWKWIAWRDGLDAACLTVAEISMHCGMLIFESGLTGTGIDLVKVGMDSIGPMLKERTGYKSIEMVGHFPRDNQNVNRPVWVCK